MQNDEQVPPLRAIRRLIHLIRMFVPKEGTIGRFLRHPCEAGYDDVVSRRTQRVYNHFRLIRRKAGYSLPGVETIGGANLAVWHRSQGVFHLDQKFVFASLIESP